MANGVSSSAVELQLILSISFNITIYTMHAYFTGSMVSIVKTGAIYQFILVIFKEVLGTQHCYQVTLPNLILIWSMPV